MTATRALKESLSDAARVVAAGLLAFAMFFCLVSFGPSVDGWLRPVLKDYQIHDVTPVENGGFSFIASFTKVRDCTYYGVTWFAQEPNGNLVRVQLSKDSNVQGPPITGPLGKRTGDRVTLYPPAGSRALFALNHHDCGFIWQTRTMLGPFIIKDNTLSQAPLSDLILRNRTPPNLFKRFSVASLLTK